jgi:hypothetical protein
MKKPVMSTRVKIFRTLRHNKSEPFLNKKESSFLEKMHFLMDNHRTSQISEKQHLWIKMLLS